MQYVLISCCVSARCVYWAGEIQRKVIRLWKLVLLITSVVYNTHWSVGS